MFCYYLSKLENSKEAAVKAGYPPQKADAYASKLMRRPEILKAYKRFSKQLEKRQMRQMLICGINRLAFGTAVDGAKLAVFSNTIDEEQLEQLDLYQVSELKKQKDGGFEVKFFDRFKAFSMLDQLIKEEESTDTATDLFTALNIAAEQNAMEAVKDE